MSTETGDDPVARAERAVEAGTSVRLPDGRRLAYATFGVPDGSPVVLFHGFPHTGASGALAHEAAVDAGVRLVCPTRPGLGDSDPDPERTLASWTDDVSSLADDLDLDEFGVAGVSAGGPYALSCAASLDRVRAAAVLVGVGPPAAVTSLKRRLLFAVPRRVPRLARLLLWLENRKVAGDPEARRASLVEDAPPADEAVLQSPAFDALAASSREARKNGAKPMVRDLVVMATPWPFALEDVRVSTVLYYGGRDPVVPASDGRYLAERLPDADLTVDPAGGHLSVPVEYAGEALARVAERV